jgi:predicted Na+-dependent transporter
MAKVFGLPIVVSILLGVLFPYFALRLMPLAFVFLFLLMVWAGFTIEWHKVSGIVKRPQNILVGLLFLYLIFPLGQWVIARLLIHDRQILYGLVFASLTPVAIVAPFFTNVIDGDEFHDSLPHNHPFFVKNTCRFSYSHKHLAFI